MAAVGITVCFKMLTADAYDMRHEQRGRAVLFIIEALSVESRYYHALKPASTGRVQ